MPPRPSARRDDRAALARVGDDGAINVEDGTLPTASAWSSPTACRSPAGFLSPGLALDEVKGETVFERPDILLASVAPHRVEQLAPVLERVAAEAHRPAVIADEDRPRR